MLKIMKVWGINTDELLVEAHSFDEAIEKSRRLHDSYCMAQVQDRDFIKDSDRIVLIDLDSKVIGVADNVVCIPIEGRMTVIEAYNIAKRMRPDKIILY